MRRAQLGSRDILWLALLGLCLSNCQSTKNVPVLSAPAAARPQIPSAIKWRIPLLDDTVGVTANKALGSLHALDEPLLADRRVAFQSLPLPGDRAAVIYVEADAAAALAELPEVCAILPPSPHLSLCTPDDKCRPADSFAVPIIACNLAFFKAIAMILRAFGSAEAMNGALSSDANFMKFLRRLRSAADTMDIQTPSPEEHVRDRLLYLQTFVLAHEIWHIRNRGKDAAFARTTKLSPQHRALVMCRNRDEYARQGWTMTYDHEAESADKPKPVEPPDLQALLTATQQVWKEELAADAHATSQIEAMMRMLQDKGVNLTMARYSATLVLSLAGLYSWYSRLSEFADNFCGSHQDKPYFLTWCMCLEPSNYAQAGSLLGSTHPSILLRMVMAVRRLTPIPKHVVPNSPEAAILQWQLRLAALSEVPLTLTHASCGFMGELAGDRLVQFFPALEGFFETEPHGHLGGYGGPPTNKEQTILMQCVQLRQQRAKSQDPWASESVCTRGARAIQSCCEVSGRKDCPGTATIARCCGDGSCAEGETVACMGRMPAPQGNGACQMAAYLCTKEAQRTVNRAAPDTTEEAPETDASPPRQPDRSPLARLWRQVLEVSKRPGSSLGEAKRAPQFAACSARPTTYKFEYTDKPVSDVRYRCRLGCNEHGDDACVSLEYEEFVSFLKSQGYGVSIEANHTQPRWQRFILIAKRGQIRLRLLFESEWAGNNSSRYVNVFLLESAAGR